MSLRSHKPLRRSHKPLRNQSLYEKSHKTYRILHNIVNPDKIDEHKYYDTRYGENWREIDALLKEYTSENVSDDKKEKIEKQILELERKKPKLQYKFNTTTPSIRKGGKTKKRRNKRKNRKSAKKRFYEK